MSKQTMDEVYAPIDAHYKNIVLHQTWGHLFPQGIYYEGYVRIANSIYSYFDAAVLNEQIEISSSPWWYEAITEFAYQVNKDMDDGEVADFKIAVIVETVLEDYPEYLEPDEIEDFEQESYQRLNISTLKKTLLVKGYNT